MVNIGVIGYGYWGPNLVRNFVNSDNCRVKKVVDGRADRLKAINKLYPSIETSLNAEDIFNDISIDAVVIATPVFTHFELAQKALQKGKHVLVEKPFTSTSDEASKLIDLANKIDKVIMVDHTFLYTGAVKKIKEVVDNGEIGSLKYFDSTRINLGLFQADVNVLWDLAPHDISILQYISKAEPYSINAIGISHTHNDVENIAYLTVNYNDGLIAHFNCSWTSPVKIRMILIGGDKKMIAYNDNEPTEKVKIYQTSYEHKVSEEEIRKILVDYRTGEIFIPKLNTTEALAGMVSDFINAIENRTKPESDCYLGLRVVKILEAAQQSIKNKGKEVII